MSDSLHKLQVIIEGNAKGLNKASKDAMATVGNLQKKMKELAKETQIAMGLKVRTEEYKNLKKDLSDAEDEAKKLNKQLEELGDGKAPTETYQEFEALLAGARSGLESLRQAQNKYVEQGKDGSAFTDGIIKAEREVERYEGLLEQMRTAGTDMATTKEFQKASEEADKASAKTEHLKGKIDELVESGRDIEQTSFGKALTAVGTGMMKAFSKPLAAIKKTSGAFSALIQKFKTTGHRLGDPFKQGIGSIFKYVLGIGALVKAFQLLRRGISEGMGTLSKYSQQTRYDLNSLTAGLNTVKLGLANAFAPVLTVIAPILNTLMDMLVDAMNVVSAFFATLTGASTYNKASRSAMDYGAALDGAAGSAGNATEANEKLKRSIMGFDQINKLDNKSSGGSGGSGGGGGAGGSGAGLSMEQVPTAVSNFAEMVKKAWESADFTEIGNTVGKKLKTALDNIPWDGIKSSLSKIASSTATFLNGFFGTKGLSDSIGSAIGEMVNTGIDTAYVFVTTFNFSQFGSFVGNAISKAIEKIDFAKGAITLSNFATGIFSAISSALETINWFGVGNKVGEFIKNIKWKEVLGSAADAITNGLIALLDFGAGLLSSIIKGIKETNWSAVATEAWNKIKEEWEKICDSKALMGIDSSVLDAIGIALLSIGTGLAAIKAVTGIVEMINGIKDAIIGFTAIAGNVGKIVAALDPVTAAITALGIAAIKYGPEIAEKMEQIKKVTSDDPNYYAAGSSLQNTVKELQNLGEAIGGMKRDELVNLVNTLQGNGEDFSSIFGKISEELKQCGVDTTKLREVFTSEMTKMGISSEEQAKILGEIDGTIDSISGKDPTVKIGVEGGKEALDSLKDVWKSLKTKTVRLTVKAKNTSGKVLEKMSGWFKNIVTKEATVTADAKDKTGNKLQAISNAFESVKSKTVKLVANIATNNASLWDKVTSTFKNAANKTVTLTANITQSISEGLKKLIPGFKAMGGIFANGTWQSIPQHANGAVQRGGLFYAGEAGPEIVARGSGGRSEILNKSQIASAIHDAVLAAMMQSNQGNKQPAAINVYVGGKRVTDVVVEEVNNRTRSTGKCPILI